MQIMQTHICPSYFIGIDVVFQMIFLLICLFIAYRSLVFYEISRQRESLSFGCGFGLLGISYGLQAVLNTFFFGVSSLAQLSLVFLHILSGLAALITLAYAFSHVKSQSVYLLLLGLMAISLFFSVELFAHFYFVGALFFGYIVLQCLLVYAKFSRWHTLVSAAGFFCLFLAQIFGMLSLSTGWSYVLTHIIALIGYVILLMNVLAVKHEKKARSA